MNKIDLWKKYQLFELFEDLESAREILTGIENGSSSIFPSAKDFYKAYYEELYDLRHQNVPDFKQICIWFAPNSIWNNFVGIREVELENRIFERATKWNKNEL